MQPVRIDAQSPAFRSAVAACREYIEAGNGTPAESAAETAQVVKFSQCMRSHGVPNFPDPSIGPFGKQVMDLRGLHIDLNGSIFQTASQACQKVVPGSKL